MKILHSRVYHKSKEPLATFVLIHGLGEHSGRYLGIAKALVDEAQVEVQMIDLRGYGGSGGGRAMSTFHQLQSNIAGLFARVNPELPIFLFGHSMGGGNVGLTRPLPELRAGEPEAEAGGPRPLFAVLPLPAVGPHRLVQKDSHRVHGAERLGRAGLSRKS